VPDITWFLELVRVGGKILEAGPVGLLKSVSMQYIKEAVKLGMGSRETLRSLIDSGIDYGYTAMQTDYREIATEIYSIEKSANASLDRIFAKSWMGDKMLPSHANYLVTLDVNTFNPATQEWEQGYRSIYSDDRLSPQEWFDQFMSGQSTAYQPVMQDYQLNGIQKVMHNHGFSW